MKPETHHKITEFVVNQYLKNTSGGRLASDLNNSRFKKAIIDGSRDEDKATPSRGLNWHFYPANNEIENDNRNILLFLKLRPTSRWIVENRQEKVIDKLDDGASKSIFKNMGRVLHHIQDMSTPTHVVPVYHDHELLDPFETYLVNNWFPIEVELNATAVQLSSVIEKSSSDDFVTLYDMGGKTLLKNLESGGGLFPVTINEDMVKVSSDAFWLSYALAPSTADIPLDIKGFGSFGPLGEKFGECSFYDNGGATVAVDSEVYNEIAVFFTRSAVEDSLKALKYFETMYNK